MNKYLGKGLGRGCGFFGTLSGDGDGSGTDFYTVYKFDNIYKSTSFQINVWFEYGNGGRAGYDKGIGNSATRAPKLYYPFTLIHG